jgi:hypothetical protein
MRRSILQNLLLFLGFVAFFSGAVAIQHKNLEKVKLNPPFVETWLLSGRSAELLKLMALRYDLVAADFLWLRAIQSFGGRGMTDRDWKPLYNMFDTITELDPYFENAYTFGNMVIGDEGGRQREGLALLEKGMFRLVRQYRIPFEGMYVAHWQMGDTQLARWYGRIAMKRQDAPNWVPRVVAYIELKAGAYYIGFDRFLSNYLQGLDAKDVDMQRIALSKVQEAIERWNKAYLLRAFDEYTSQTGHMPRQIEELAGMPALASYEVAKMSKLVAALEKRARAMNREYGVHPDLRKLVPPPSKEDLEAPLPPDTAAKPGAKWETVRNEIFKESLVTQKGIPEDPYGTRYVINQTLLGYPWGKKEDIIVREPQRLEFLKGVLEGVRASIAERRQMLGRVPKSLHEVFYTDFQTTEPYGATWKYDPATGDFRSTSHPEM